VTAAPIRIQILVEQLSALGVQPGTILVVHTAFSRVGPVEGGPLGLVQALSHALGASGTLVMPSMTDDDDHVFDPKATPCRGMGIVADTFWRQEGVERSDSPHAFAARGPQAARILRPHPPDVPHGADSPVGRVYELGGSVLLLGVGHDANTTVHLAESMANVPYRVPRYTMVSRGGVPTRLDYAEADHCCERFALLDDWLDAEGRQRRGRVGRAQARLVRASDVVAAALARLATDPLVFLHPRGVDVECDAARASVDGA